MYPCPASVEEKLQIFYEAQSSKKHQENSKEEYFKGYIWQDVQKNLDGGLFGQALNKAYGICRNVESKKR